VLSALHKDQHVCSYVQLWFCCLLPGTNDNSVYVYDIESKHCVARLTGHGNDVNAVAYLQVIQGCWLIR
jgi:WD40 repeat protein